MGTIEPGAYVRTPDGVGKVLVAAITGHSRLVVKLFVGGPQLTSRGVRAYAAEAVTYLTRDPLVAKIEATLDRYEAIRDDATPRAAASILDELIADMRALTVAATPEREGNPS